MILLVGDLHLSSRRIESRVDDLAVTSLAKLKWLLSEAVSREASIVCTGDFSHASWSSEFRYSVKLALRDFKASGLGFYSIRGNHDFQGGSALPGCHSELGHLILDGYITDIGTDSVTVDHQVIQGIPAYADLDTYPFDNTANVLVCHHWIVNGPDSLIINPNKLRELFPLASVLAAGHDHAEYSSVNLPSGFTLIRPGSLIRTSIAKDSDRIPRVVLLEPYAPLYSSFIPCPVAKPYSEVFMVETHDVQRMSSNVLSRFTASLVKESSSQLTGLPGILASKLASVPIEDREMVRADIKQSGFDGASVW